VIEEGVMAKAAVIILAGTEGHVSVGRLVNGLETAKEFAETDGDDVELTRSSRSDSGFREPS
jgi:hypothetical protein